MFNSFSFCIHFAFHVYFKQKTNQEIFLITLWFEQFNEKPIYLENKSVKSIN